MSFERDVKLVFQSLLDENRNDYRMALWDLAHRYVHAVHGYSPGYMRTSTVGPQSGRIDDVPNPIDDAWLNTARGT